MTGMVAASRFTGADAVDLEHLVIASSGDLAYTAGFERSHVSVDDGPRRDMTLPITYIYRRIDGDWKLVHRHADFPLRTRTRPPRDRRPARAHSGRAQPPLADRDRVWRMDR
jgi:SnoaL-like domain